MRAAAARTGTDGQERCVPRRSPATLGDYAARDEHEKVTGPPAARQKRRKVLERGGEAEWVPGMCDAGKWKDRKRRGMDR